MMTLTAGAMVAPAYIHKSDVSGYCGSRDVRHFCKIRELRMYKSTKVSFRLTRQQYCDFKRCAALHETAWMRKPWKLSRWILFACDLVARAELNPCTIDDVMKELAREILRHRQPETLYDEPAKAAKKKSVARSS